MRLVYTKTGIEVKVGQTVKLSDGEMLEITGFLKPYTPYSSGRVVVRSEESGERLYFPGVIGAEWIEREDQ